MSQINLFVNTLYYYNMTTNLNKMYIKPLYVVRILKGVQYLSRTVVLYLNVMFKTHLSKNSGSNRVLLVYIKNFICM